MWALIAGTSLIAAVVLIGGFAIAISVYKHAVKLGLFDHDLQSLKQQLAAITKAGANSVQAVHKLEQQVQNLNTQQEKLDAIVDASANFKQADKMVSMGANVDDIVQSCGLIRAEAELIAKMQAKTKKGRNISNFDQEIIAKDKLGNIAKFGQKEA